MEAAKALTAQEVQPEKHDYLSNLTLEIKKQGGHYVASSESFQNLADIYEGIYKSFLQSTSPRLVVLTSLIPDVSLNCFRLLTN